MPLGGAPYYTGTQNRQRILNQGPRPGMYGAEMGGEQQMLQQNLAKQRELQYARMRMQQMRRLAQGLTGEDAIGFNSALGSTDGLDPAAAWRFISGQFANLARGRGYEDPRMFLQQQMRSFR